MTYALGHAFTVAALGIAVLELHLGLPEGLDHWTERLIGLTLIVLGIGVVAGILRKDAHGHSHSRIESRLAIAINGFLWMAWRVRRCWNPQAPQPERFQWMYNGKSVFVIGILHGVGAETPSQLALFFLTANLGGTSRGMLGLAAFALGLVAMNALMTATMGGAFRASGHHHPRLYHAIAWTGAAYSFIIGLIFLFGISDHLPGGIVPAFTPPPLPSDDKRWKIVNGTMRKNGFARHALIETLHTVQSAFGYLDDDRSALWPAPCACR
jgi:cytochrome c biogenesis protein CcdA